ncbi:extracellular solute-binding protein [Saliterribacillus persicus]|uniref:Carbohydrate ABC transporter substrate-binding protein (CUT1 family) n=1 Tax=Saliterribacillus persicus TaxID=930114 RepID=A0A368YAS7_9BACI|nr:extracellular solute-binding protein [Saliterribacillus persicus]RCW77353.1 carbohydrate ABC transporter substrate-binding protein (CUT1 family) [Saliterribacillus persicus]
MKKTFLFLLLSLLLVLTACSGSGGSEEVAPEVELPEGTTEVVMWNLFGGGDAEYMEETVDAFNESQDEYYVNNVMQEFEEYYTKLLTSIGAGKGPDLAISHSHVLPELVSQGLVVDMTDIAADVGVSWEEFNQNILDATVYENQHFAIPIDTHAQIMYVNNELVEEAGLMNDDGSIDIEESPEGYIEFFKTLDEKLPEEKIPFSFSSTGSDPYWLWWAMYSQLGGDHILTEDNLENPTYDIDLEKAKKAAEYVQSLYQEHEIIPLNIADFYSEFQSGNAATTTTGVWATGIWETTEDLEFTPLPIPNVFGEQATWASSHTLILPYYEDADTEVQKGAVEFMKFATDNGAMWAEAGHIPSKDSVIESEEFQELPYRSDYAEVADYVNFVDRNIYARGIEEIITRNLDSIWSGEVGVEEAFSSIETEIKDLIE